jgi:hypothetical protein
MRAIVAIGVLTMLGGIVGAGYGVRTIWQQQHTIPPPNVIAKSLAIRLRNSRRRDLSPKSIGQLPVHGESTTLHVPNGDSAGSGCLHLGSGVFSSSVGAITAIRSQRPAGRLIGDSA